MAAGKEAQRSSAATGNGKEDAHLCYRLLFRRDADDRDGRAAKRLSDEKDRERMTQERRSVHRHGNFSRFTLLNG